MKSAFPILVRGALFLLLVLLVTGFRPAGLFTAFAPIPQILFGLLLLACIFLRPFLDALGRALLTVSDRFFLCASLLLAFGLTALANVLVLDRVPHVTDSAAYLLQAKLFAMGRYTHPATALPEFFRPHFFFSDAAGRFVSLFQPGWPLILTPGVLLGIPWLINPLLGALTLWPLYRIVRRGFGPLAARLSVIVLLCSPFFVFMSASFMAHTASGLISLVALDQMLLHGQDNRRGRLFLSALLLGLLFTMRSYNAVLLVLPLAFAGLPMFFRHRFPFKELFGAFLIFLAPASVQFAVNAEITGDPFSYPQDLYFAHTEPDAHCHRLGFGADVGCEMEHGQFGFPDGFYFSDALGVTRQRISSLALNFLGVPAALALLLFPLAAGRLKREGIALILLLFSLVAGYFFFYYHGNCFGPRFYYEAVGSLGFLVALGALRLDGMLNGAARRLPSIRNALRALAPALLLTMLLFTVFWVYPKLWHSYKGFRGIDGNMRGILEESGVTHGLILLPGTGPNLSFGLNVVPPGFDGEILFARHHYEQSAQLMYAFPERDFYRLEPRRNRLIKLRKQLFDGVIFIKMDSKMPAWKNQGGFAESQNIQRYTDGRADRYQAYFDGHGPGAYFAVRQFIFEPGAYRLEANAMRGPYIGNWRLVVNDTPMEPEFPGYAKDYGFTNWRSENAVRLERGMAELRFEVTGKHPKGWAHAVGVESLVLRRIPDGLERPVPPVEDLGYMDRGRLLPLADIKKIPKLVLP